MGEREPEWRQLRGGYALPEGEVHVWRTTSEMPDSGVANFRRLLSGDERERADRFRFEADGVRWVVGRGLLRLLLGGLLNKPASLVQIEYNEFGKPCLMAGQGLPLQFNVSHSGGLVLIALAVSRAVGLTLKKIQRWAVDLIAGHFFSANERKELRAGSNAVRGLLHVLDAKKHI